MSLLLCLILAFSLLCSPTSAAVYYLQRYSNGSQNQETSTWCWAASAVNAVLFTRGYVAKYSGKTNQQSAVYAATGSYTYSGSGSLNQIKSAATYASGNEYSYTTYGASLNWYEVVNYIMLDRAVIAGGGKYSGSTRTGGHIFMIFKVDTSSSMVYFVDPWTDFTTETARRKSCSFSSFVNGCKATMNYEYDCTVYQL